MVAELTASSASRRPKDLTSTILPSAGFCPATSHGAPTLSHHQRLTSPSSFRVWRLGQDSAGMQAEAASQKGTQSRAPRARPASTWQEIRQVKAPLSSAEATLPGGEVASDLFHLNPEVEAGTRRGLASVPACWAVGQGQVPGPLPGRPAMVLPRACLQRPGLARHGDLSGRSPC